MNSPDTSSAYKRLYCTLLLAAAYFITGKLALLLAIPPGYAAPVWPAAGLALAGVLLFGNRIWPGIFIGSFLVNIGTSLDTTGALAIIRSISLPAGIAAGAVLQALAGVFLIRRLAGFSGQLDQPRDLFLIMALGGPVSCVINSALGCMFLLYAGAIGGDALIVNWVTWWVGDTIGVMIIVPLATVWSMELYQTRLRTRFFIMMPVFIAVALTIIAFLNVRKAEWAETRLTFERQAELMSQSLKAGFQYHVDILYSIEALYAASRSVERQEFHDFVSHLFVLHPGTQAFEWIPRIAGAERASYEAAARREGHPEFTITELTARGQIRPALPKDEYFPVYYTEPYNGNEKVLGLDMSSNPARLDAMLRARDAGKPAATSRVKLVQDSGAYYGALVFMPVYRKGHLNTVEDRRRGLLGYAVGVFRIDDMAEAAIGHKFPDDIDYRLYDKDAGQADSLLYSSAFIKEEGRDLPEKNAAGLHWDADFEMAGRHWSIHFTPTAQYLAANRQWGAWGVLTGGLLFSSLIGITLLVSAGRTSVVTQLVDKRTAELSTANAELEREVLAHKETVIALQESDSKFRAILNNTVDGIITIDEHAIVQSFNLAAERIFGYKAAEVIGQNVKMLQPEPYHSHHDEYVRNYVSTGNAKIIGIGREVVGLRKDGSTFPLDLAVSEVPLESRRLFAGIIRDITERKRVEAQLRETLAMQRAILNHAGHAIISTTPDGLITTFNPAAERLLGYSAAEVVGLQTPAIIHDPAEVVARAGEFSAELGETIAPGFEVFVAKARRNLPNEYEWTYIRKDSTRFPVLLSVTALRDDAGRITGFLGLVVDITLRKQAEEALRLATEQAQTADRAKSDFLASMSHEIRTPMNAIIGMAELLSETELTSEQRQYVRIFQSAGENLLTIINDILDISKVEAGHLELEEIVFDPCEVVENVCEIMALRAHKKGLDLTCRIMPDVPAGLQGDPLRLRQVLVNLVGNSIKFTEKGEVSVEVKRGAAGDKGKTGELVFSVTDTGIGVPADKIDSIFERFSQVDASTTRKYGGTGLGLSISMHIVELMGGRMWVESDPGKGSTFYFTALFKEAVVPEGREQTASFDIRGLRAIVIDDNATNRLVLKEMLMGWGAQVTDRGDGKSGLTELKRAEEAGGPYQLVLLDCRMPEMDGFEVAEEIRKHMALSDMTIMMLTSDSSAGDIAKSHDLGIDRYMVKPVKRDDLRKAISAAMSSTRPAPTAASTLTDTEVRPLNILLVDDSEDNRILVRSYLKKSPYKIDVAENGEVAVEKAKAGKYDLVLMDMQMPVMDGYTATREIRKWEDEKGMTKTPVIALTAHALKEDMQKSLDAGCDAHLTKPVKKAELLEAINRITRTEKE